MDSSVMKLPLVQAVDGDKTCDELIHEVEKLPLEALYPYSSAPGTTQESHSFSMECLTTRECFLFKQRME